jgi:hypothetical protein
MFCISLDACTFNIAGGPKASTKMHALCNYILVAGGPLGWRVLQLHQTIATPSAFRPIPAPPILAGQCSFWPSFSRWSYST